MLNELTIAQAAEGLKNKDFSSVELTTACLKRIKKRNKQINAFITVDEKNALAEAKKADKMIGEGNGTVLTGIPFSVKDAICTKGMRSTGAARILDNYIPPFESTVVAKIRTQGGVLVGKNNCDAFGHGASNENSMYGPVKNPHDTTKVAGGSSGGSAAAVADDMCIYSIAEDTGGSIRQPASFCGMVGMRPSYGRNSRYGIMPMGSSLDTIGPLTKTVEDAAILMETMAGHDPKDATTVPDAVPKYTEEIQRTIFENQRVKIGVPKEYLEADGMDPHVKDVVTANVDALANAGADILDVSLPHTKYAIPAYYIIVPSEDSSNLGRLDGIRYGVRLDAPSLSEVYGVSRAAGFPDEVRRRIMIGTFALSVGYYDAYYRKAQKVRTIIRKEFDDVFSSVDALVAPTSPFPAFGIGEKEHDVLAMYLADAFVSPAALAGLPAISVPAGTTSEGLPIGLQIIGPRMAEGKIMSIAHQV